jgi:hypothetical protein
MKKYLLLACCMWVAPIYAQSVLPAPTNLKPGGDHTLIISPEYAYVTFSWNKVETATSYELQFSKAEDNFTTLYYQVKTTALIKSVNFLNIDKIAYIWRVRAINATQISEWSAISSFSVVVGTSNEPSEENFYKTNFSLYPTPSHDSAFIEWTSIQNDTFKIDIWDLKGQQLQTFSQIFSSSGKNQLPINLSRFPNGYYMITITSSKEIFKLPLVISH